MKTVIKIAIIINIVIGTIKLAALGILTPTAGTLLLVASIIILAGGKRAVILTSSVVGLFLLTKLATGGDAQKSTALLQSFLTLVIILVGLYVMFRGVFTNKN